MAAPTPSQLDASQVLQSAFDDSTGSLRVLANATIEGGTFDVSLDAKDDSVSIGNPNNGNTLAINADGSINIVSATGANGTTRNYYSEQSSVPSNTPTVISTFTVANNTTFQLIRACVSSTVTAEYTITANGNILDKRRTSATEYNTEFDFTIGASGIPFSPGDVIQLVGVHFANSLETLNGRIQGLEKVTS